MKYALSIVLFLAGCATTSEVSQQEMVSPCGKLEETVFQGFYELMLEGLIKDEFYVSCEDRKVVVEYTPRSSTRPVRVVYEGEPDDGEVRISDGSR